MLSVVIQLHLRIVARLQVMVVESLSHGGFGYGTYFDEQKNKIPSLYTFCLTPESKLGSGKYKALTEGHDRVLGAVPDVDLVPLDVLHRINLALACQLPHDLVDVFRVGAGHLRHVGTGAKDTNPGNL